MSRNLSYLWSLLPGLITISGNYLGGYWAFSNVIFVLIILGSIEWFFPEERSNEAQADSIIPGLILSMHVLFEIAAIASLVYTVSMGKVQGWQVIGAALSTGIHSGTSSIVVAHELIHRKNYWSRFFGKFLLFMAGNTYFYIEHLRVHHKWVGTEKDPATAKRGETVYVFFIRSMTGQITNAFSLEKERLKQLGKNPWLGNQIVHNFILQLGYLTLMAFLFSPLMVAVLLIQMLIANFLLEYTNYIEHYGLSRKENERVREEHSWQTDKVISRFMLIDLSRHSDHHYYASKPFHTLQSYSGSPVLPGGYASAIYMALIPAIWFKVVDAELDNFLTKNNKIAQ
jgi:alkane 1-monooxygenase